MSARYGVSQDDPGTPSGEATSLWHWSRTQRDGDVVRSKSWTEGDVDTGGWNLKPYQLVYVATQAGCWVEADAIDRLNEEAQFLLSIRGETPRDVWREQWRLCQMSRTAWFLADELSRSNPDKSLRQTIVAEVIDNRVKVD